MSQTVILAENPLEFDSWTTHEVEDVRAFLLDHFKTWPQTARIYHKYVAQNCDITPEDEPGIERLGQLSGPFIVVVYPGETAVIVAIIAVAAAIAAMIIFQPKVPNPSNRNPNTPSPNNGLSDRQNVQRIGGRIPDILGQVRSTPDLIAPPYSVFEGWMEVEHCLMSVGRGYLDIQDIKDGDTLLSLVQGSSAEVYDPNVDPVTGTPFLTVGDPIEGTYLATKRCSSANGQIMSARTRYYRKGVVVTNSSHIIDFDTGTDLSQLFYVGQRVVITFDAGDNLTQWARQLNGTYTIGAIGTGTITLSNPHVDNAIWDTDWQRYNATYPGDHIEHFASIGLPNGTLQCWVEAVDYTWIGPFVAGENNTSMLVVNFIALNGMYKDDGENQYSAYVDLEVEVQRLDEDDNPVGSAVARTVRLDGSNIDRSTRGVTLFLPVLPATQSIPNWSASVTYQAGDIVFANNGKYYYCHTGPSLGPVHTPYVDSTRWTECLFPASAPKYSVRARRLTSQRVNFTGQVQDEVKWRDLYAATDVMRTRDGVKLPHFGDITTIRTRTLATEGALSIKERKLNCIATRRVPVWIPNPTPAWSLVVDYPQGAVVSHNGGLYYAPEGRAALGNPPGDPLAPYWTPITGSAGSYSTTLVPSRMADDILAFACKDSAMGRRPDSQVDTANFRSTIAEVVAYFGTHKAAEFNYTFDQANISFEEIVASIASAVFCHAYRRGSQIRIAFEKTNPDSSLLFNHRNKIPGSETRTVTFGNGTDNDGVEFQYVDPRDDAVVTLYLPADQTAQNAQRIDSIGVRNKVQAYFLAHRLWNRIRYQHVNVEFEATQEAELLLLGDRILVADNTRPDVWDGDVMNQNVLELTLSQRVTLGAGSWVIFLQHMDGTVESIPITQGSASNKVILGHAPSAPLAIRTVDNDLEARALYWITKAAPTRETAFIVTEREPKTNFTSVVRGVNYDDRYYENDKDLINDVVDEQGELT